MTALPADRGAAAGDRSTHATGSASRVLPSNGSPALVLALGPDDEAEVLALHHRLSDRDRYLRFGTMHPVDLANHVRRSVDPGGPALSLGARVHGELVGVVELFPTGGDTAEVAAVVDGRWRQHGLATVLLEELAAVALRRGIRRLVAEVLSENTRMLDVFRDLGLPTASARKEHRSGWTSSCTPTSGTPWPARPGTAGQRQPGCTPC